MMTSWCIPDRQQQPERVQVQQAEGKMNAGHLASFENCADQALLCHRLNLLAVPATKQVVHCRPAGSQPQ
jgi:hypothetical protein